MATTLNHYIVILCGGTGPRLWPLSHADKPKQFLKLFSKKTLLEETLARAKRVCPSKNIFIVSNQKYQEKINQIIGKKIPAQNFLYEPVKKNTAMAIIFAISHIYKINPNAVISTTPADHYIQRNLQFKKNLNQAFQLAATHKNIVTIGIKATSPNPSYGYILPQQKSQNYSNVSFFIEKPDRDTAEKLIKKNCFWNSGIYTFTIDSILSEFKKLQPEYFSIFEKLISKTGDNKSIESIYQNAPDLAIDRAISERSKDMLVIPASFDWSDVGEWKSIRQNLKQDADGHAVISDKTEFLAFNSKNCLINGPKNKLIGLVGVNNLAIIDTPDSLLICNLDQSANVRDLVTLMIKKKKYKQYFLKK
jgi:mannose-1-phosphate guanylyltransferase